MKIHFQDKTGDTTVDLETETDLAKKLFEEAISSGKMAYAIIEETKENHIIWSLDDIPEKAERIVVCKRQVGG